MFEPQNTLTIRNATLNAYTRPEQTPEQFHQQLKVANKAAEVTGKMIRVFVKDEKQWEELMPMYPLLEFMVWTETKPLNQL